MGVLKFKYDVPLEQTMALEAVYQEALQLDLCGKRKFWDAAGSIFVWMLLDGELVGESCGFPLASSDGLIEELTHLTGREKKNGVYCYSNTILPSFQKQGFATILKAHSLGLAAAKGFETVYGHARPGASQALNAKFGALFLENCPDWAHMGEEYR